MKLILSNIPVEECRSVVLQKYNVEKIDFFTSIQQMLKCAFYMYLEDKEFLDKL